MGLVEQYEVVQNFEILSNRLLLKVKKKFRPACLNLLYLKLNKGTAISTNQKKVIPPANNMALCTLGICSK
jgi:hypothetical protein